MVENIKKNLFFFKEKNLPIFTAKEIVRMREREKEIIVEGKTEEKKKKK